MWIVESTIHISKELLQCLLLIHFHHDLFERVGIVDRLHVSQQLDGFLLQLGYI